MAYEHGWPFAWCRYLRPYVQFHTLGVGTVLYGRGRFAPSAPRLSLLMFFTWRPTFCSPSARWPPSAFVSRQARGPPAAYHGQYSLRQRLLLAGRRGHRDGRDPHCENPAAYQPGTRYSFFNWVLMTPVVLSYACLAYVAGFGALRAIAADCRANAKRGIRGRTTRAGVPLTRACKMIPGWIKRLHPIAWLVVPLAATSQVIVTSSRDVRGTRGSAVGLRARLAVDLAAAGAFLTDHPPADPDVYLWPSFSGRFVSSIGPDLLYLTADVAASRSLRLPPLSSSAMDSPCACTYRGGSASDRLALAAAHPGNRHVGSPPREPRPRARGPAQLLQLGAHDPVVLSYACLTFAVAFVHQ